MKCPKCQSDNPDTQRFCGECGTQIFPSDEPSPRLTETLETSKEELTTGSTFADRYQIIEELGKGGMGRVYKVMDTKIQEKVALKLLKPEIAVDKKTIERFSNELKFARKIRHKNVCQMYDLNEEKGTHYITMEYVPGEDLKSMIRMSGQLSVGTVVNIARQVCEGLTEALKVGVVHRDLKPQNIMIDRDGNARIMDFGIARSIKSKGITGAGVTIGTPEYMSPEQVEGKEVDQCSDIYSLGVIIYEMVAGRVPFEGDTPLTIGVKHRSETPKDPKDLNPQISEDLSNLILRCIEKEKEKRYQSAGELREELVKIEKGIPTTERKVPTRKPITSKEITVSFSIKKLLIPALVVVALVIAVVVILQVLPQKEAVIAPKIENSIAVISFENQTGDKAYDYLQKAIPNLLITSLEQTGGLYVVTWERLHDLLAQTGKKEVEIIDRNLGFRLCLREGVEAIVLGSFVKAGDMFATDVKVLDVDTKRLLKSAGSRGEGVDSILKTQIDELSKEISEGVGIVRERMKAEEMQIADVTTSSMEAYRYFIKGWEETLKFYYEDARKSLEKAVDIDPTFATAYLFLATTYSWVGNTKKRNQALEKAKYFSQKATDKERLFIDAAFAYYIERDVEKRGRILQQLTERFPKEKNAHYSLGVHYRNMGNLDKTIEVVNKALELDPNFGEAHNELGYAYLLKEDYEKAVEHFKTYGSMNPEDANPLDSLAEAYFLMGRLEESLAKYKEAIEIKPDFYDPYFKIGYIYALKENYTEATKWFDKYIATVPSSGAKQQAYMFKGLYQYWLGRLEQSLISFQKVENLAEDVGNELMKASVSWVKTFIYYDRGEYELSRKYNENWPDTFKKYNPGSKSFYDGAYSCFLGLIELNEGRIDSAKTRLTQLSSYIPELGSPYKERAARTINWLQTEIWLAEGFPEKAVTAAELITPLKPPALQFVNSMVFYNLPLLKDELARAYKQNEDLDRAISEYERLLTFDPKSKGRYLVHPKYHYRIAILYEEKGWRGKAIEQYEKFLEIWKDADPGTPGVEDAKKRLAGLQEK